MKFIFTIDDLDNDAFQPEPYHEIARLLRATADRVDRDGDPRLDLEWFQNLRDINGNVVGTFALKPKE